MTDQDWILNNQLGKFAILPNILNLWRTFFVSSFFLQVLYFSSYKPINQESQNTCRTTLVSDNVAFEILFRRYPPQEKNTSQRIHEHGALGWVEFFFLQNSTNGAQWSLRNSGRPKLLNTKCSKQNTTYCILLRDLWNLGFQV